MSFVEQRVFEDFSSSNVLFWCAFRWVFFVIVVVVLLLVRLLELFESHFKFDLFFSILGFVSYQYLVRVQQEHRNIMAEIKEKEV